MKKESPMCIYYLRNGLVIYSDNAVDKDNAWYFDMERAVVLSLTQGPQGQLIVQSIKGTECPFCYFASKMIVERKDIVAVSNTVNETLISNIRQAISKIEIVQGLGPHR